MNAEHVRAPLLVDAHVHLHASFEPARLLAAAAANFRAAAAECGLPADTPGCLLLADMPGAEGFQRLSTARIQGWSLRPAGGPAALLASDGNARILIAAGRQIATSDGLEVLALLSTARLPAADLPTTVALATAAGAVPVVPWGFGKWTFRRRAVIEELIRRAPPGMFLGDNGGRLHAAPEPALFGVARSRGTFVLPGSDPLPFPGQQERAGSRGFVADVDLGAEEPAAELRAWLAALREQPPGYGRGESLGRFVIHQARMQHRKRTRGI